MSPEARQRTEFLRLSSGAPAMPWCYVQASELPREFDDALEHPAGDLNVPPEMVDPAALFSIMAKDRKCPEWWPFTDPITPEEHRRERASQRLEQDRRKFERQMVHDRLVLALLFTTAAAALIAAIFAVLVYAHPSDIHVVVQQAAASGSP
jgi:hypothetical protein